MVCDKVSKICKISRLNFATQTEIGIKSNFHFPMTRISFQTQKLCILYQLFFAFLTLIYFAVKEKTS